MVLDGSNIQRRIEKEGLIQGAVPASVEACSYVLTAGKAFAPTTGAMLTLREGGSEQKIVWEIGPSETLVVMTTERVILPEDLCATYVPVHRLAVRGVMLLNFAIVNPGYEGNLSCHLVNFSSEAVVLHPGMPVAKIVFHTLTDAPSIMKREVIEETAYEFRLAEQAKHYHRTFLDIEGIENRAVKKAEGAARKSVILAGIILAMIVGYATFEPIAVKYLFDKPEGRATEEVQRTKLRLESSQLSRDLERLVREAKEVATSLQNRKLLLEPGTLDDKLREARQLELELRILELKRKLEEAQQGLGQVEK